MQNQNSVLRLGLYGAAANLTGILLSGPLGLVLIALVHPNLPWQSARVWAENYHPIQTVPFFFGFLLLGGYIVMLAVAHQLAEPADRVYTSIALLFTAAFATLIFFNYICQTTFLPALAAGYRPEYEALISGFSFANPASLGWAIEMWGYALLGVATLFAARIFTRSRLEKITAALMIANGLVSVLAAFATAADLSWVMTPAGLFFYSVWNLLVAVLAVCFYGALRGRMTAEARPVGAPAAGLRAS